MFTESCLIMVGSTVFEPLLVVEITAVLPFVITLGRCPVSKESLGGAVRGAGDCGFPTTACAIVGGIGTDDTIAEVCAVDSGGEVAEPAGALRNSDGLLNGASMGGCAGVGACT